LIVPPVGRERVRICHELTMLGRDLAAAGFPTLRLDYRGEGEGESGGEFRHSTLTSRVADTVAAAEELRRRTGVRQVALVGLHLGAAIAAVAAPNARADRLILCDPVSDLRSYVKNLFRAVVIQQGQTGRATTEADLRAVLSAGGVISVFGFPTAAPFIDELESLDRAAAAPSYSGELAMLYFANSAAVPPAVLQWSQRLGGAARCTVTEVPVHFSWTTRRRWTPRIVPLNAAILAELASDRNAGRARAS
jgi:pimeloyl-ACP methyl ester carboxylesterase